MSDLLNYFPAPEVLHAGEIPWDEGASWHYVRGPSAVIVAPAACLPLAGSFEVAPKGLIRLLESPAIYCAKRTVWLQQLAPHIACEACQGSRTVEGALCGCWRAERPVPLVRVGERIASPVFNPLRLERFLRLVSDDVVDVSWEAVAAAAGGPGLILSGRGWVFVLAAILRRGKEHENRWPIVAQLALEPCRRGR